MGRVTNLLTKVMPMGSIVLPQYTTSRSCLPPFDNLGMGPLKNRCSDKSFRSK